MNKEENKETVNLDKVISKEMFAAIIAILVSRQNHFMTEINHRKETRCKTNDSIEAMREKGATDIQIENLKYLQNKMFESTDLDFKEFYKEEFVHQKEVIEFLNTFTNNKWEELTFDLE